MGKWDADLVRALAGSGLELQESLARHLGFAIEELPQQDVSQTKRETPAAKGPLRQQPPAEEHAEQMFLPANVPFWCPHSFTARDGIPIDPEQETAFEVRIGQRVERELRFEPLAPISLLLTRLRQLAELHREGHQPDVDRIVRSISRGQMLTHLPRRTRRSWGAELTLIGDLNRHLIPYRGDWFELREALQRQLPDTELTVALLREGQDFPTIDMPALHYGLSAAPASKTTVIAVTDLGCLAGDKGVLRKVWCEIGRKFAKAGVNNVALFPGRPEIVPSEVSRWWKVLPWERGIRSAGRISPTETERTLQRLMAFLALAKRIEPRLLRAIRRLLPETRRDAGLEARVWHHPAMRSDHSVAATIDPQQVDELLQPLASENVKLLQDVLDCLFNAHRGLFEGIWHTEVFNLPEAARCLVPAEDLTRADGWFEQTLLQLREDDEDKNWQAEFVRQADPYHRISARRRNPIVDDLWDLVLDEDGERDPPESFDPARFKPVSGEPNKAPQEILITQIGTHWKFASGNPAAHDQTTAGDLIGSVRTMNEHIRIDHLNAGLSAGGFEIDRDFWSDGMPPAWASDWGIDELGPWAEFQLESLNPPVTQRMRWIAAGTFLMGSPADEPGRYKAEGPRHEVTISRGFWMFDTACTQGLWEAVMGSNPSCFKSPDRPVEQVSWEDCQQFLTRLRELVPGLEVELPTEAEWEFACRAGTDSASYAGPVEILGDNNAPALDAVAWYGGNSGLNFELENGVDASGWAKKQYEFEKAGTHPVGLKTPNSSGLYDMLGNVREWCRDAWASNYSAKSVTDPERRGAASAERVVRGGSWNYGARFVRAAYRNSNHPAGRYYYIGFRCRVQSSEPSPQAAEPQQKTERAVSGRSGKAEPRGDSSTASEVARAVVQGSAGDVSRAPESAPLVGQRFLDALARIPLSQLPRPVWASGFGRDEFGLWAEFQVSAVTARLRLIPPGTFLMGSPEGEDGRFEREGPQHTVTITEAFWMFDTPCVQAFWVAVTGDNPSSYKGSDRPVENVSWEDCQQFNGQLARKLAGLEVALPTEAEWEYACRADTTTATYAGGRTIEDDRAAEIESIAWYLGNSREGTKPVRQKQPNAWGLYDTLGNVREWCLDGQRIYDSAAASDPSGPAGASAERVVRGGSWDDFARYVRAACRGSSHPADRLDLIGFRCRVQARELQQVVGRASARRRSERSRGDSRATSVARAAWINLIDRDSDQTPIPQTPQVRIVTDLEELTLCQITKPGWASAIGRDRISLWAEFEVPQAAANDETIYSTPRTKRGVITQRLRWLPPGRFLMGSPKDEPGRWEGEFEPRIEVIHCGFWLFDTPCTQALWETVMGSNPSRFKSPDRPVEQVSWEDCRQFTERFDTIVPGLKLSLPTEAEWEYACRAGTADATYAGPIEILGINNAPVLDAIAWYGGNCGVRFDLEEGHSTTWSEKQYEFDKGGTRTVATKAANPWGLYDMLGNVLEWCEDVWQSPGAEAQEPEDLASAERVVRGGSWDDNARYVRAAYRYSFRPANRDSSIGFRCRVQDSELEQERASGRDAASAERRSRKAEPGEDSDATSEISHADDLGNSWLGRIGKLFGGRKNRE